MRYLSLLFAGLVLFGETADIAAQPGSALADIDGEMITAADLERSIALPLAELRQQIYDLQRAKLDELIDERLLKQEATKRGLTVEALLATEVTAKAGTVIDQELAVVRPGGR